jgi:hypothetical protein
MEKQIRILLQTTATARLDGKGQGPTIIQERCKLAKKMLGGMVPKGYSKPLSLFPSFIAVLVHFRRFMNLTVCTLGSLSK